MAARAAAKRALRLRDEHHAFAQHEPRTERFARPGDDRIPMLRLRAHQTFRRAGAIADEIGAEIFRDLVDDGLRLRRNAVDDRIGKARERHGGRIDALTLRVPFGGDRLPQCPHGGRKHACRRRFHGAAIEQKGKRRALADGGCLIEPLAQARTHVAPRRLHRIERLGAEQVFKDIAHEKGLSAEGR